MNSPHPLKLDDLQEPDPHDFRLVLVGLVIVAAFFAGYAFGART
jgi:hypothetical protein